MNVSRAALPATRRSQRQRREEMCARIIASAIDCLVEQGYAASSTIAISRRAGVSQGALFRHFPTRYDLMVAVAGEVGDGLIASYGERFRALAEVEKNKARLALRLLRENCRARINQAWFELLMAARTDDELRQALEPIWIRNSQLTCRIAEAIFPEWARLSPQFQTVILLLVSLFHGEAVDSYVHADAAADEARMNMAELICDLLAAHYSALDTPSISPISMPPK